MFLSQEFVSCNWKIRYELLGCSQHSHPRRTIVFVHGTPWSSLTFEPLTKALLATGSHRILLYDLPGYGQSQEYHDGQHGDANDTSVKTQAFALSELLAHLHLHPDRGHGDDSDAAPDVVAHDIAGTIALRSILFHHCRFRSLLLMDTNCVLPWGDGFYKLARAQPDVFQDLPPSVFEATLRAVIRSACFDPRKLQSGWEEGLARPWLPEDAADEESGRRRQRSFVRQIAQANDGDVAEMQELYWRVSCPMKILWGEKDRWIPKEKMEQLAKMLKHGLRGFVTIPEAGHLIMVDQPERVTAEVILWLQSQ